VHYSLTQYETTRRAVPAAIGDLLPSGITRRGQSLGPGLFVDLVPGLLATQWSWSGARREERPR